MIVHMRNHLRSGGPIILHDIPVVDAGRTADGGREHAQPITQVASLGWGGACEFGRMAAGTEEKMAAG